MGVFTDVDGSGYGGGGGARTKEMEVLRLAVRIAKAETDEQILAYGRQIQQLLKSQ